MTEDSRAVLGCEVPAVMRAAVLVGTGGPEMLEVRDNVPVPRPRPRRCTGASGSVLG